MSFESDIKETKLKLPPTLSYLKFSCLQAWDIWSPIAADDDTARFDDWDWVPMASGLKIGIGYLWHRVWRLGLGTYGIGFEDWDWVPMASDVKIGIGYRWHQMWRLGLGTYGIRLPIVRLASVSGVIGSLMSRPKSAKSVSVLAVYNFFNYRGSQG